MTAKTIPLRVVTGAASLWPAERPMQVSEAVLQQLRQLGHTTADERPPYPSCNGVTKLYDQLSSHADSRGGGTAVRF